MKDIIQNTGARAEARAERQRWAAFGVGRQAKTEKYVFLLVLASTLHRVGFRVLGWNCFNLNQTDIFSSIGVY